MSCSHSPDSFPGTTSLRRLQGPRLGWGPLLIPLMVIFAGVTALAVGLWLSPLHARFRDVGHTIPFLVQCWIYASPVVYPLSLVPERWRMLYSLNPMVVVVQGFRWALLGALAPDPLIALAGIVTVQVLLLTGLVLFAWMQPTLADAQDFGALLPLRAAKP